MAVLVTWEYLGMMELEIQSHVQKILWRLESEIPYQEALDYSMKSAFPANPFCDLYPLALDPHLCYPG